MEGSYSLALKDDDGTVYAWGANSYGQLGSGTTTDSLIPIRVQVCSRADGTLVGVFPGNGTIESDGLTVTGTDTHFTEELHDDDLLVVGTQTRIVTSITSDTKLIIDSAFSPDVSPNTSFIIRPCACTMSDLKGVTALSVSGSTSLALLEDKSVVAWGGNSRGQLGIGTIANTSTPVQVKGIGGTGDLSGVTAIAAIGATSLALLEDKTVVAWGVNSSGQLGIGTNEDSWTPRQVCAVYDPDTATCTTVLRNVTAISGQYCSLALTDNGSMLSWGGNTHGQLGVGDTNDRFTPVPVQECRKADGTLIGVLKGKSCEALGGNMSPLTGVTAIGAAYGVSFAVVGTGDNALSWGATFDGKLGDGSVGDVVKLPFQILAGSTLMDDFKVHN
jgi:alpha-tubulin suppressor-like RCC1 family protein